MMTNNKAKKQGSTTAKDKSISKGIYEYAVLAYVFAHCAIWPDRVIGEVTKQTAIDNICKYLKNCDDLEAGVQNLYRNVLLVIVNRKYWVNLHPHTYVMLLEDYGEEWSNMKQSFIRRLNRVEKHADLIASIYMFDHNSYADEPSAVNVDSCMNELVQMGKEEWARLYAQVIHNQRRIFGQDVLADWP